MYEKYHNSKKSPLTITFHFTSIYLKGWKIERMSWEDFLEHIKFLEQFIMIDEFKILTLVEKKSE